MAWNNDDWQWVADGPSGGIYQNKYNPSLYANSSGGVGTKEEIMGSSSAGYSGTLTDEDGSVTGTPGTKYQKSASGNISIIYRPPSGGGGTTYNYNTTTTAALGPNRYTQGVDMDGSRTGYPGATYQIDNLDGSITVISKGSASGPDPDGDGYDNSTGLPVGVKSIGGKFYYQGKQVNADGSLYDDSGDKPNASTWTGYGPKGQGTYYLDGPNGTPGTYIGATTAGGGGSTNISVSGIKSTAGSGGGGSSSSAVSRDYAAEDAASDARSLAAQKEIILLQNQLKNDPNNPYLQLQIQGLQLQQQNEARQAAKDAAETKRGLIKDFQDSVTSTDPSAMHSWLYANGVQNGGNIVNRLGEGGDALSPNVLTGTAALLQMLRGQGANIPANYTAWMNALPGLTAATAPQPAPGTPTTMGGLSGGSTSAGGGAIPPSGSAGPTVPSAPPAPTITQRLNDYAASQAAKEKQQAYDTRNGYFPISTPAGVVYKEFKDGVPTGAQMTAAEHALYQQQTNPFETGNPSVQEQIREGLTMAQESKMPYFEQARRDVWDAASQADKDATVIAAHNSGALQNAGNLGPYVDPTAGFKTASGGTDYRDKGTASSTGSYATVYNMPGVGWVDTNQVASTGLARDISTPQETVGTAKPYIPPEGQAGGAPGGPVMRALGGNVPGMAIVGDSVSGKPTGHEELVIDPTHDARVIPINRNAMARMRGLPRLALGGSIGPGWNRTPSVPTTTTPTAPYSGTVKPSVPTPTVQPTASAPTPVNPVMQTAPVTPVQSTQPPQQQPVAAPTYNGQAGTTVPMQGLTTPSGTYQTNTITPGEQALLDEARQVRETVPIPDIGGLSPYSVEFQNLAPSIKEAWFKGMAAAKGVNPNDFMAEVGRNVANMPGLSRGQMAVGY